MLFDPKKDFTEIRYPQVFKVDNPLENLPEIGHFAVILSRSDRHLSEFDRLIRYMMAYYDKKSPLVLGISNIAQRKNEAALVAGYDLEKDAKELEAIFSFEGDIEDVAIEFLKEQNDMYWAMRVSNEQCFWEYQLALNSKLSNYKDDKQKMDALNVKSKLMDECHRIAERVDGYNLKIFGDADTVKKVRLKEFSPESIAHRKNV